MHPPASIATLDVVVEEGANSTPADVDVESGWGNPASAAKHEWGVDVAPQAARPLASCEVGDDRETCANEPVPLQDAVDLAGAEDTGWANGTPDNGGGVEDLGTRAGKGEFLFVGADVGDVAESPVEDRDLDDGGPEHGDALSHEHGAGRDLHVMAHLEILEKVQSLGHGNVAVALEHHSGERAAGLHVAEDEFSDDVGADLPIGDGLDHANGDQEDDREEHGDDECPPCHMSVPGKAGNEAKSEQDDEENSVPPFWAVRILAHHLEMDIGVLVAGKLGTCPNLLAVVERGMDNQRGISGEGDTVCKSEVGRQKKRRVSAVSSLVDSQLRRQNLADIVDGARIVVR